MRLRGLIFFVALLCLRVAYCDVGVQHGTTNLMASVRNKKIHGTGGYKKATGDTQKRGNKSEDGSLDDTIQIDTSAAADEEREKFRWSFKHAYDNYFAATVKDADTGELKKQSLGAFQDLMIDYQNLDIIERTATYSTLEDYLPERDARGAYPERWIYYRTLDGEPELQDGADGPISKMFYKSFWQGVVICVRGNGRTKCMLAPRNHLKSTVAGQYGVLWRAIREPAERHTIRCVKGDLAKKFLKPIVKQFESNKEFLKLFGNLIGEKRKDAWNTEMIQFAIDNNLRRGVDPTIQTAGAETDMTGTHWDNGVADDIVAKSNSSTPTLLAGTRELVSDMHAQRDAGSRLNVNGTRWNDDDAYSPIVGEPGINEWSGTLAKYSCFFVATVLDGDKTVSVPLMPNGTYITPLGYGKPIWPEGFPMTRIEETRAGITNDYHWAGQYYNQFIGTSNRVFKAEWISEVEKVHGRFAGFATARIASELKLNIFMAADTAGGKADQTGKVDKTAAFVGGQTPDRREFYLLDGFCEKLPAERIAVGIVRMAMKWKRISEEYGGMFRCGFETTRYTEFLAIVLREEQKKYGASGQFSIVELKHAGRAKVARIEVMAQPYAEGRIIWPATLFVEAVKQKESDTVAPYDLRKVLQAEFVSYHAKATEDNLIDAHAYAWEMTYPTAWKEDAQEPNPDEVSSQYSRQNAADFVPDRMSYQDVADAPVETEYY